jgi:hypothetical protein
MNQFKIPIKKPDFENQVLVLLLVFINFFGKFQCPNY